MKDKVAFSKVYNFLDDESKLIIDREVSTLDTDPKDMPLTRKTFNLKSLESDSIDDNIIKGYISTRELDWSKDIVIPEGIILDVFKNNPLILWNHNKENAPIAKATSLTVDEYGVLATIEFADTEYAQDFKKLAKGGFLSSFSIGFIPLVTHKKSSSQYKTENEILKSKYSEYKGDADRIISKWVLLEASLVTVPDNPTAIITQKSLSDFGISEEVAKSIGLKVEAPAPIDRTIRLVKSSASIEAENKAKEAAINEKAADKLAECLIAKKLGKIIIG